MKIVYSILGTFNSGGMERYWQTKQIILQTPDMILPLLLQIDKEENPILKWIPE